MVLKGLVQAIVLPLYLNAYPIVPVLGINIQYISINNIYYMQIENVLERDYH